MKMKPSILSVIANQRKLGSIGYVDDTLSFSYEQSWLDWEDAFDLSVSMPLSSEIYGHKQVEPYLWGLLPDNSDILRQYGMQFHVSPRNVFRLLEHVGQDCPGAIQFIAEKDEGDLLNISYKEDVDWITKKELDELIVSIKNNKGLQRLNSGQGQFSLAGAQPKTALYQDRKSGRWGIPKGLTPTSHILKPAVGEFAGFAENEHFCLRLAEAVGMDVAKSSVIMCADIPVIVVERYDRVFDNDVLLRVHQEDICQARSVYPERKYENEGGPRVAQISETIWDFCDDAYEDITKFADSLILNYLIIGADAHAKNYSLLHKASQRIRLTPLYDVVSALPYPNIYNPLKVKFAMKIGGEYLLREIDEKHWEVCAKQLKLKPDYVMERLKILAKEVMQKADSVVQKLYDEGLEHEVIEKLSGMIKERCESVLDQYFSDSL